MNAMQRGCSLAVCLLVVLGSSRTGLGQGGWSLAGGPLTGPPVPNAPFSADATTTVRQTLSGGTLIERIAKARYFRDREGRVRVEQSINGSEEIVASATNVQRITVWPDPADSRAYAYTLEPLTRTARKGPRDIAGLAVGGGDTFAAPLGGVRFLIFHSALHNHNSTGPVTQESLGSRLIAGVETVGRRVTTTIPGGQAAIQVTEERWESPELKILMFGRSSDPRVGIVDYRLSNVRRAEPDSDLFVVPNDYTVVSSNEWITLEWAENAQPAPRNDKRRR
jgi:hypothetical protein